MGWPEIMIAAISALGGGSVGAFTARQSKQASIIEADVVKEGTVLTHYDKIVDQLQEEVLILRAENAQLRSNNNALEREVIDMQREMLTLSRTVADLQDKIERQERAI